MIIVIVGPTGVGKTKLSESLSEKYDAVVVNADAVQVYKELNIGSAKPKLEEMSTKNHFLFDIKSISEDYNVKDYQKDLRYILDKYKNKNVIIVGGTGLYISAALYDYQFSDEETMNYYDDYTNEELYKLALEKDENMDIHLNNRIRLIRFLNKTNTSNNGDKLLYDAKFIGLKTNRDNLYNIIDNRVDNMIKEGLLKEVESLEDISSRVLNSAIGYKELLLYFNNKLSLEEAIELIKKNSRNYAKRQFTWFNNKMNVNWFDVDYNDFNNTINSVCKYIEKESN